MSCIDSAEGLFNVSASDTAGGDIGFSFTVHDRHALSCSAFPAQITSPDYDDQDAEGFVPPWISRSSSTAMRSERRDGLSRREAPQAMGHG